MKKARIAVLGGARGKEILSHCLNSQRATLVAVCDYNPTVLAELKEYFKEKNCKPILTENFEDLIKLKPDGIVLANYANEHAPFAIRCLKAGINVMSEVLPAHTLKEAVELVEAVEASGLIYCYAENYCYLETPLEMKKLCDNGLLGEIEYAEGEYFHNLENIWHNLTYGQEDHWRNIKHAFYYCTHSLGPIIHATKLRPVSVVGFEAPHNDRSKREGIKGAPFAVEMITLENGAIVRSSHGQTTKNNVWYALSGSRGRIEGAREFAVKGKSVPIGTVYCSLDISHETPCDDVDSYVPKNEIGLDNNSFGHELADKRTFENFAMALRGEPCDVINVYEAMDMFLPGIFAYKSVLNGGIPQKIPNFRIKEERDLWRNDISSTDKKVAGDQWIPSYSKGNPTVDKAVYDGLYKKWCQEHNKEEK